MLTVNKVLAQMSHALGGGEPSVELDKFAMLNEAGEHLYSMYSWKWAQGRSSLIDLRGAVDGTTATWTAATKTLTQASGFTNYVFLAGDTVEIRSGTGATVGVYFIASRTSANAIVLEGSIASGNLATGDIFWSIFPGTIALPADLRDIISIRTSTTSNLIRVCLTSLDEVNRLRGANAITSSPSLFYAAMVYTGSPLRPILEVWPSPGANATGALRIFYRSRWTRVYGDSDTIDIPEFVEELFIFLARAVVEGYERGDVKTIHQRLAEVQAGPIYRAAVVADGQAQPFRRIRNGGAMIHRHRWTDSGYIVNRVQAPI